VKRLGLNELLGLSVLLDGVINIDNTFTSSVAEEKKLRVRRYRKSHSKVTVNCGSIWFT